MTRCALLTDVCHWIFKTKVNMAQGQEDGPLSHHTNAPFVYTKALITINSSLQKTDITLILIQPQKIT